MMLDIESREALDPRWPFMLETDRHVIAMTELTQDLPDWPLRLSGLCYEIEALADR